MTKNDLKKLIKETIKENMYASQNPDDFSTKSPIGVPGTWTSLKEVDKLKKNLMQSLDAGNFDMAIEIVNKLSGYHT